MSKRWRIRPHDPDRVSYLERTAGVPAIVAQLLVSRGVTSPDAARTFLEARLTGLRAPDQLPGAAAAAERICQAVRDRRRIVVYGDYDADGMTATALLVRCLTQIGASVGYYVPNRLEEGYGLNDEALGKLAEQGASLIVSVDCGITSVAEAETARRLGLDLVITDHHEMGPTLPAAHQIVHPRLPGTDYPFGELCGAGVALKLAWAICQQASQGPRVSEHLRQALLTAVGLAAIGTVADVVPLLDENRILVRHGLRVLRQQPTVGLAALMKVTGLDSKPELAGEDIGFVLAPRLNAAGRLGQAQLGVELLTTDSHTRAAALAEYIQELNNSRDSLERSIYQAAKKQAMEQFDPQQDAALVLAQRGWHPGVIGIVAGRLAEKFHRPVVMIALDQLGSRVGSGSARSAGGLNLHQTLSACSQHLLAHGGHAAAAGLRIDEAHIDSFRTEFCEHAACQIAAEDRVAELHIDAEAPLTQLTLKTAEQIELLAPFGHGNPRPLLCAQGVQLAEPPRRIGKGERHLSCKLTQFGTRLRAVAFHQADWADQLPNLDAPLDVAFRPVINEYLGRRSVELHLVDWRPSQATAAVQATGR